MKFSWKGGELHRLSFKYTWVHVWVHRSELARRGVLIHELGCTWVETAQGALCRQVLRSRACEAEENLSAKCTECSFNPNVNEEVAKYTDAEFAWRGVLGLPPSWIGMCHLKFSPFSGVLHMSTPTKKGTRVVEYSQLSTWLKIEKKYIYFFFF